MTRLFSYFLFNFFLLFPNFFTWLWLGTDLQASI